jgi:hypothetical protein
VSADHVADTVAQIVQGKGQHYELCILDFNMDIETGVCSITLNSKGKGNRDRACDYCYAAYLYRKDPNAYKVKAIKENEFKKIAEAYPAHVLRLGKNFECGHKNSREALIQVLEYCVKYNMRPVVTTKILEFDKRVADLVIQSRGIVHISIGRDEDESGAVAQGATNAWRLKQAIKYKKYKCPTQIRIVADITMPMSQFHKKAFEAMGGSHGVLFTPLHYTSKSHFESMRTDITWEQAKETGLFTYVKGDLRPNELHSSWTQAKERCGTVAGQEYCNNCVGKIDFNKTLYKKQLVELGWNAE